MSSETKNIVLQTENLSIGYFNKKKPKTVGENINFSLAQGELIGLVGANGIGKSTLLRTLAGMQIPISGKGTIFGKPISEYSHLQLANHLSLVLTESPASKNLTVLELVSLGRQPYTNWMGTLSKTDKNAIHFAMEATESNPMAHKKCYELSDGQMQRVAIARALAQDTPIIILDEPTTHLDLYHRAYILKLLKKLASESKKAILFSTHEIDLAIQLTDKMLVMTPEVTYFDDPCNLIEAGRFEALFPNEIIGFDTMTGKFNVKK